MEEFVRDVAEKLAESPVELDYKNAYWFTEQAAELSLNEMFFFWRTCNRFQAKMLVKKILSEAIKIRG